MASNWKLIIIVFVVLAGLGLAVFSKDEAAKLPKETENTTTDKSDLIVVSNPQQNQIVTSPLRVAGEARGSWYFEADFPVYLYDVGGNLLGQGIGQAQGEWMTTEFVPFEGKIMFSEPEEDEGYLVFERSNPSGLRENADELRIPVRFR